VATGITTTGSLNDSLPFIINSARVIRPYAGIMTKLVERHTLAAGEGMAFDEVALNQLLATNVTENTILDNPQMLVDSLFSTIPQMAGIHTIMTRRASRRISTAVKGKIGVLAQQAMETKKDKDLLAILDGASVSLGGAGATFSAGLVSAAAARIRYNTSERGEGELFTVLHPFQLKDVQDDIVAGVGTYTIPTGLTEDTFRRGFSGTLFGTNVFVSGNIAVDGSDDAKGGVFVREALVLVQGASPTAFTEFLPAVGGGADALWMYDDYALGERSAGNWLIELYSDVTPPTS